MTVKTNISFREDQQEQTEFPNFHQKWVERKFFESSKLLPMYMVSVIFSRTSLWAIVPQIPNNVPIIISK